jgi:ribosomal-protein-alanine N-acetyltransferase
MNNIRIVPMTADHLDALEQLERTCFSRPWSRKMLAEELDLPVIVHEREAHGDAMDILIGYAGLLVAADEGYITNVAVFPQYRRRGAAGKLLDVFLRFARANHLAFLTLEVRPSNAAAIALYTRFGFREAGRRRNYYDLPKEDALILTRTFEEDDQ